MTEYILTAQERERLLWALKGMQARLNLDHAKHMLRGENKLAAGCLFDAQECQLLANRIGPYNVVVIRP